MRNPLTLQEEAKPFSYEIRPVLIHAIPLCVSLVFYMLGEPQTMFFYGGITATATYLYLILREARGKAIVITPITCYLFWFLLVLGPAPVYLSLRFPEDQAVQFLLWLVPMPAVATGYVITLLGACCLHLGLVRGRGRYREARSGEQVACASVGVQTVAACAAVSFLYAHFHSSLIFLGSTVGYLLQDLGPAAACLYAASWKSGLKEAWLKIAVLVPVTVALGVVQGGGGSKMGFLNALIPLTWFLLLDKKRRRLFFAVCPVLAVIFIYLVTPVVTTTRLNYGNDHVTASGLLTTAERDIPDAFSRDPQGYMRDWTDQFAYRLFIEPIAVGYIVTRVEGEGYTGGSTMSYVLWGAIPRFFWEDKPVVNRGQWFTSNLGFSLTAEAATTSTGMTSPGELYWNFGWRGGAGVMILMGYMISRMLWRLAAPDPRAGLVEMLPYTHILMTFMVMQDAEAGSSLLMIVQVFLLYWVVKRVVQAFKMRQRRAAFGFGY